MAAITTPEVRVSFPTVFTPKAIQAGQTPKYSVVLMFDKNNQEHMACVKRLHAEASDAQNAKWPDPTKAPRIPLTGHDKSPIKDGDKACNNQGIPLSEKNPEYAGHYIVRAATTTKPVIVDTGMQEILDSGKIYGGCWCKVNINPYAYDTSGNKGVTFGLNGVQLMKDGESFGGGRPAATEMFEASSGSEDPANYGGDPFSPGSETENSDPFA